MARTVDRIEGLGLIGRGMLGNLSFAVPALLERPTDRGPPGRLCVSTVAGTPPGHRHLAIGDGTRSVDLTFPVPAPEITGAGGSASEAGLGSWVVHWPPPPEALQRLRAARPELLVLGNARALWSDGEPFIQAIGAIRKELGSAPLLWAPRVALPHRIPMLQYLGIDLMDTTEGEILSSAGTELDESLGASAEPAGTTSPVSDTGAIYRDAFARADHASRVGRLRELVEARLAAEPALSEMLRYADRDLGDLLEEHAPVVGHGTGRYVLAESLRRPEMRRFRARLLERYRPPASKEVLLLVPCSRTKPYRNSRSHRRFWGALEGLRSLDRVHVVSLSSPVGLVPRELEDVYPARQYDIPVTGEWSEAERQPIREGLHHMLGQGRYRAIVAHLDPAEYGFVREAIGDRLPSAWTIGDDRTTTTEALASLRDAVAAALVESRPVPGGPLSVVREELAEVAAFQFGRFAADRLFAGKIRLAGRPWFQRLVDPAHIDLATWREERGLFHLTLAGGQRLLPDPPLAVEVSEGLTLTGDLFVPGVRRADPAIRVGDAVVLMRDGKLLGVGEALLPGRLMTGLTKGSAVRVRHREHPRTDTPMMGERSSPHHGPVV
ncbi:MAG: DUF5591 domain-containing protein [Thermoplasmata archaeon]|nr:DUF5591 domain-containing protein [Thermoplasmata archaeon]